MKRQMEARAGFCGRPGSGGSQGRGSGRTAPGGRDGKGGFCLSFPVRGSSAGFFGISGGGVLFFALVFSAAFASCTFDYGLSSGEGNARPDVEMSQVEYTRVRDGETQVRFKAEKVKRWEERMTMELEDFSFEQFENRGEEVNVRGAAGMASVDLDSGNVRFGDGVSITVESEDLVIETGELGWDDKGRSLSGPGDGRVIVRRSDGTFFTGRGFSANSRTRTWEFSGEVSGVYVHEDGEDSAEPGAAGAPGQEEEP